MRDDQQVDLGSIKIHKKVIADIAVSALDEIQGVAIAKYPVIEQIAAAIGYRHFPAVIVQVDEDNQVSLEIKIVVQYGYNVPDVAHKVQESVRSAIDRTADVDLKDLNVNIQGIERS